MTICGLIEHVHTQERLETTSNYSRPKYGNLNHVNQFDVNQATSILFPIIEVCTSNFKCTSLPNEKLGK